jgi:hypothetical protein
MTVDEQKEQMKDWQDVQKKWEAEKEQAAFGAPCPSCGRCPTCGRGGYSYPQYVPPYYPSYPYPYYPYSIFM